MQSFGVLGMFEIRSDYFSRKVCIFLLCRLQELSDLIHRHYRVLLLYTPGTAEHHPELLKYLNGPVIGSTEI